MDIFLGSPTPAVKQFIIEHYGNSEPSELETPLYFEGQEDSATVAMIAWNEDMYQPEEHLHCNLECSIDSMSTWSAYDGEIIQLDSCAGKRVYFRAPEGQPNTNGFYDSENYIFHCFKLEKAVKACGNIQFLLESTGTRADVPEYAFYPMFGMSSWDEETEEHISWCGTLTQAPTLPAMMLADSCYNSMFQGCTSLVQAPALPAKTLADSCYSDMFHGCTSLVQAPALPAKTLADSCYNSMFSGCTSLVQAPALPATMLANYCYSGMFKDCTSLSSIEVSFSAWNPGSATQDWVNNVASTGTFTCPTDLPQTTGNIPNGWTIVTK